MPEGDFKRAIMDAISRSKGKLGLSEDFKAKVDQHWDQFVGNPPKKENQPESPAGSATQALLLAIMKVLRESGIGATMRVTYPKNI